MLECGYKDARGWSASLSDAGCGEEHFLDAAAAPSHPFSSVPSFAWPGGINVSQRVQLGAFIAQVSSVPITILIHLFISANIAEYS